MRGNRFAKRKEASQLVGWPVPVWKKKDFTCDAYLFFANSKNGPAEDEDDRRRPNHLHQRNRHTRQPQHAERRDQRRLRKTRPGVYAFVDSCTRADGPRRVSPSKGARREARRTAGGRCAPTLRLDRRQAKGKGENSPAS